MNLPTEDNNLPLFKYAPEITSQLLIQTNEAHEYVQIPSICDDLLLTGAEDGTYTWTLNSLPILLNSQNDCQSLLINSIDQEESLPELQPQSENLNDLLSQENVEFQLKDSESCTELVLPAELTDKNFLTDNGLFITNNHEDISSNCELVNNTFNSEISSEIQSQNLLLENEIQSSDVSSQEAFIDINGLFISQQSISNLNHDFSFNIQDSNLNENLCDNSNKKAKKRKKNCLKKSTTNSSSSDINQVENSSNQINNENIDNLFSVDNFKINADDGNSFLNINESVQISSLNIDEMKRIDELEQLGLQIDDEPDSTTLLNDLDEALNIDDLATIVQTYQCKKCDYKCNDQKEFLAHFKEWHYVVPKKKTKINMKPLEKKKSSEMNETTIVGTSFPKNRKVKRLKKMGNTNFQIIINEKGELVNGLPETILENDVPISTNNENCNNSIIKDKPISSIIKSELNEDTLETDSSIQKNDPEPEVDLSAIENNSNVESAINSYEPLKIIYDNKEYTGFAVLIQHEEVEKKIMRLKPRKKIVTNKTANNCIQTKKINNEKFKNSSDISYSLTNVKKLQINTASNILQKPAVSVLTDISTIDQIKVEQNQHDLSPIFIYASNDVATTSLSTDSTIDQEQVQQQQPIEEINDLSNTIFLCATCGYQFSSIEECKTHYIEVHKYEDKLKDQNEIQDDIAKTIKEDLSQISETEIPNHKEILEKFFNQDVLKKRKHKCPVKGCVYRFAKLDLLKRHEACHINGSRAPFCCPECKEKFNSWRTCSLHLWKCHKVDIDFYTCPLCDYKGSTYDKLKHHIKIHSENRDYVCPDCGRDFKQPSQLRNHRIIHLDKTLQNVPRWYIQKYCEMCGKLFADSKCLKKHIQAVHSKLKPFICNVCGHSCARKAMLQLHLRQHTGDKPYACSICRYKTGDHNSLRRHTMRHTGDKPYKCPYCDYAAIQSHSYKNHLTTKHPEKNGFFKCNTCSFQTVNEYIFNSHKNDHKIGLIQSDKGTFSDKSTTVNNHNKNGSGFEISNNNENGIFISSTNRQFNNREDSNKKNFDIEDDETQNCLFSSLGDLTDEQTVDTGGITIPADPDELDTLNVKKYL